MSGINITDLHEEILEKIFLYTSSDKIKELTEVCTKFNDVIGSSARLMDKFVVNWNEVKFKDIQPLLASKRKYRNVQIDEIGVNQDLVHFLNIHNLTKLTLHHSTLSIYDCELILKIVRENIVDLKFYEVKIWGEKETAPINFPNIDTIFLNAVKSDKMSLIFNFFKGAKVDVSDAKRVCKFLLIILIFRY